MVFRQAWPAVAPIVARPPVPEGESMVKLGLSIVLFPMLSFGMDRMSALSMLETGNNDAMVGRAGEISRYQILKNEWKSITSSTRYQDPSLAREVTLKLLEQRVGKFTRVYHRLPSDFEFYVLWNAPAQVLRGHISQTVSGRAERFANLCTWEKGAVAALKKAPRSGA